MARRRPQRAGQRIPAGRMSAQCFAVRLRAHYIRSPALCLRKARDVELEKAAAGEPEALVPPLRGFTYHGTIAGRINIRSISLARYISTMRRAEYQVSKLSDFEKK